MKTNRPFLSTQEAARLCQVDRRTMLRWLDSGLIHHHLTGGGWRRIQRSDLLAFMRERGMPIPADLDGGPPRIAIIDDDKNFTAGLKRFFEGELPEADVRVANDGFAGGLLVMSFRPDLVVLDIVMPGIGGLEVCRRIREQSILDDSAIVVVSGHLAPTWKVRLEALGASRCMHKPLSPDDLQVLIDQLGGGE